MWCLATLNSYSQVDSSRTYFFGHSLIDHSPPAIPTPSNETTVPHWLRKLAVAAGHEFAVDGQFGFLPNHANNLPPIPQLGYDCVPGFWDNSMQTFAEASPTDLLLTAANFIQAEPPTFPYYGPDSIYTPITATTTIVDWVSNEVSDIDIYIYENWPEMSDTILPYPTSYNELIPYHDYTQEAFHDWWITYQDSMLLRRPDLNMRMIPAGPIISKLLTTTNLSTIPIPELYEDMAPHGRPTLYFLAGLVTYMAIYEEPAPVNFPPDTNVHPEVFDDFPGLVDLIWQDLLAFNDANGNSRVFTDDFSAVQVVLDSVCIEIFPNPSNGIFIIDGLIGQYQIDVLDIQGNIYQNYNSSQQVEIDISALPSGMYFIRIENLSNSQLYVEKILKQ